MTAVLEPDHGSDTDRGEVADLALELLVGTGRAARLPNHADLGQDFGRLDGRLERVEEEIARGDVPFPRPTAADESRISGDEHRGPVRGWIRVRDRPADRAPISDLRVADGRGHVVQERVSVADDVGLVDPAVGRPSSDAQVIVGLDDAVEARHVTQVDEKAGLRETKLDQRDEAVAA